MINRIVKSKEKAVKNKPAITHSDVIGVQELEITLRLSSAGAARFVVLARMCALSPDQLASALLDDHMVTIERDMSDEAIAGFTLTKAADLYPEDKAVLVPLRDAMAEAVNAQDAYNHIRNQEHIRDRVIAVDKRMFR
jgi:hypothetical protein